MATATPELERQAASATRQCWSVRKRGADDSMKYGCVISRVRNPSDQSQPGRSVASLATGVKERGQKRDGNDPGDA